MNKVALIALLAVAILGGGFFLLNKSSTPNFPQKQAQQQEGGKTTTFENPKKSAHYESNTPSHGLTLAAPPINVVIDFNFDLAEPSEIKILKDRDDYGADATKIDENKLALRRNMNPDAPDGIYTVEYKACWPDKSCHEGNFQFAINRYLANNFNDQTESGEVTIKLSDIMFEPKDIRLKSSTRVTWINDDDVDHYINTDSHPAHTYYPQQNSKALKKGESFSLTFERKGVYPYHCSAHADSMTGNLLVE